MKRCPSCNRTYTDLSLNFCLEDGTPLIVDAPSSDPNATARYTPRDTSGEPPPTEIYRPDSPAVNQVRSTPQPAPPPPPAWPPPGPQQQYQQPKKSNAIWWIIGGVLVVGLLGIGLVVGIILFAIGSQVNENENNSNSNRVANRNANYSNTNNSNTANANANANANTSKSGSFTDDFSTQKWGVSNSKFGELWYTGDEYHMRSKKDTYLVMYGPNEDYKTDNATVKVTTRSVDGTVPSAGFGLIVLGGQSKDKNLQDYALLIYPSDQPEYEVIMHKDGKQQSVVSRTRSNVIRTGSNPNQLEVRIKGSDLQFYINGQYITRTTDSANYKSGLAGFYTSDAVEIAFDDLEIQR
jgi:hypothetical protein